MLLHYQMNLKSELREGFGSSAIVRVRTVLSLEQLNLAIVRYLLKGQPKRSFA